MLLVYKRDILAYMLQGRQQTNANSRPDYLVMVQALTSRRFHFLFDDSSISHNRFSHTQSGNQENMTTMMTPFLFRNCDGFLEFRH